MDASVTSARSTVNYRERVIVRERSILIRSPDPLEVARKTVMMTTRLPMKNRPNENSESIGK